MRLSRRSWAIIALVLLVLAGLALSGVLRPSSGVATTSRSMSHADVDLPGVIDPGETVSLTGASKREDVVTMVEGRRTGHRVAGDFGDVLTFVAQGETAVIHVIHRAITWVDYDPTTDAYDLPELGLEDVRAFTVPDVGSWMPWEGGYVHRPLHVVLDPDSAGRHSGFLTKGDHNTAADQDSRGGLQSVGRIGLVEPRLVTGKVVSWVEGETSLAVFWWAAGLAAIVALGHFLVGARVRQGLRALGGAASRCGACGARVGTQDAFCPRCGESRPA